MSSAITSKDAFPGLLPDLYQQRDFFLCDIFDALPKDDLASMEHPLFSLSTRPDRRILNYTHNDVEIEVIPSVKGLATIFDKDILIYCISQLMAAVNMGRTISRTVTLKAHDLLVASNRETSGDSYRRLKEAFERLAGTRIVTNMTTGDAETDGIETTTGFGMIESWQIIRKSKGGRMVSVSVTLSEWLYRAVLSNSVLTLSRDYFRLRKPLERRIYELSRKHCGRQNYWRVSIDVLLKKSGSASPRRVFRKMIRDMIKAGHLPDYDMTEEEGDIIRFTLKEAVVEAMPLPVVSDRARDRARDMMPGIDVYALEADWRAMWVSAGRQKLRAADAAFLGWVRKRAGGG